MTPPPAATPGARPDPIQQCLASTAHLQQTLEQVPVIRVLTGLGTNDEGFTVVPPASTPTDANYTYRDPVTNTNIQLNPAHDLVVDLQLLGAGFILPNAAAVSARPAIELLGSLAAVQQRLPEARRASVTMDNVNALTAGEVLTPQEVSAFLNNSLKLVECALDAHPNFQYVHYRTSNMATQIRPIIVQGADHKYYAVFRDVHQHACSLRDFSPDQPNTLFYNQGGQGAVPLINAPMTMAQYESLLMGTGVTPPRGCIGHMSSDGMVTAALPYSESNWDTYKNLVGQWQNSQLLGDDPAIYANLLALFSNGQDVLSHLPEIDRANPATDQIDPLTSRVHNVYQLSAQLLGAENSTIQRNKYFFLTQTEAANLSAYLEGQNIQLERSDLERYFGAIPAHRPVGTLTEVEFTSDHFGLSLHQAIALEAPHSGIDRLVRGPVQNFTFQDPLDPGQNVTRSGYHLYGVSDNMHHRTCAANGLNNGMFEIKMSEIPPEDREAAIRLILQIADSNGPESCTNLDGGNNGGNIHVKFNRTQLGRIRDALDGDNITDGFREAFSFGAYISPADVVRNHVSDLQSQIDDLLPENFQAGLIHDINREIGERHDSAADMLGTFGVFGALGILTYLLHRRFPPGGRGPGGPSALETLAAELLRRLYQQGPNPQQPPQSIPKTVVDVEWVTPTLLATGALLAIEGMRRAAPHIIQSLATFTSGAAARGGFRVPGPIWVKGIAGIAAFLGVSALGSNDAEAAEIEMPDTPREIVDYANHLARINDVYDFIDRPDFSRTLLERESGFDSVMTGLISDAIGFYGDNRTQIKAYVRWQIQELQDTRSTQ